MSCNNAEILLMVVSPFNRKKTNHFILILTLTMQKCNVFNSLILTYIISNYMMWVFDQFLVFGINKGS
jgi:hypothetical protein